MDTEALTDVMRALAIEAGAVIMDICKRDDLGVRSKADDSPVTAADRAADQVIAAGLRRAFPDLPLITEEQVDSHRTVTGDFLIVDPLDGTKEFIRRSGDFTVNIALVRGGVPVHGVVLAPATGRLFRTLPEGGAIEEDITGARLPRALAVRRPAPGASLVVVASKSHRTPETDAYIHRYPVADSRAAGSSLKFCLLACGEADLYPRIGPTMEWDTAAGDAVLRAAGGQVVRLDDLQPLAYGKADYRNPFFLAYVPGVSPLPL